MSWVFQASGHVKCSQAAHTQARYEPRLQRFTKSQTKSLTESKTRYCRACWENHRCWWRNNNTSIHQYTTGWLGQTMRARNTYLIQSIWMSPNSQNYVNPWIWEHCVTKIADFQGECRLLERRLHLVPAKFSNITPSSPGAAVWFTLSILCKCLLHVAGFYDVMSEFQYHLLLQAIIHVFGQYLERLQQH